MTDRRILPIMLVIFTNLLGAGLIFPILPLYAVGTMGATVPQATLLSAAFFAAQFVASPILGRLSDRYGRRPLLLVSQAGTVLSFILFIYAPEIGARLDALGFHPGMSGGLFMLFFARTLDGFTGGNVSIGYAYISDISTAQNRTQNFGYFLAALNAGFIFGPVFGGALAASGFRAPFIGAAIITTLTLLLTVFVLKESLGDHERTQPGLPAERMPLRQIAANRPLALLYLQAFLGISAFSAIPATFALYAEVVIFPGLAHEAVAGRVGLMLALVGIAAVITQLFLLKPLVARLGERRTVLTGFMAWLGVYLLMPQFHNPWVIAALLAPFSFSRSVIDPSLQSMVARHATPRTRGQMLGLLQASQSLAFIFGPIWAGVAFERIAPQAIYWVGSVILALAALLAFSMRRDPLAEEAPAPTG
ncbi:MAG: MFS transporter [Anaerolineae bacterium]|nr:MAG: MFS transporter [Anaerolineae bacterium]